jgi:hypothetical protein
MISLKYDGNDFLIDVEVESTDDYLSLLNKFNAIHQESFGFILDRRIMLEYINVVSRTKP